MPWPQERLRLAAPALLVALQELAEAVKCDSPPETLKLKMDAAEAAIKMAEGTSHHHLRIVDGTRRPPLL